MKASQLRDLTRKYAAAGIGREEYLAERARLIDGIVSGEIEIRYRELEPQTQAGEGKGRRWQYVGGSLLLVTLLAVALVAYFLDGEAPAPAAHQAEVNQPSAPIANPVVIQVTEFMQQNDWSEASLAGLESGWQEASTFHQEGARRSSGFRRLKNETLQRIREQEALVAAGEPEALLQVARLKNFAQTLGLDDQ